MKLSKLSKKLLISAGSTLLLALISSFLIDSSWMTTIFGVAMVLSFLGAGGSVVYDLFQAQKGEEGGFLS